MNAATLIERFDIRLPDGTVWQGESHYSTSRRTGRRLLAKDGSTILFDTDECYDLGNAMNRLDVWLEGQIKLRAALKPPPVVLNCDSCGTEVHGDNIGACSEEPPPDGTLLCSDCTAKAGYRLETDRLNATEAAKLTMPF